jgi:ornithine carbamoyltransferase
MQPALAGPRLSRQEIAMPSKDLLTIRDWSSDELCGVLSLAAEIKRTPRRYKRALEGRALALIFEKPSLRTRVSFDVGIQQMGGFSVCLLPSEIQLGTRESIADIARNLDRMVQAIMIRTFAHAVAQQLAEAASIPVINGLTDFSHPCQALADFMTLREHRGRLDGLTLAYVGDGNNVANSLLFAGARLGVNVVVASPPGYEPQEEVVAWARHASQASGATCTVTNDPFEAVAGADAVYTDVWASMGQEAEAAARRTVFRAYQVTSGLMAAARENAVFMHCLPAHRGEEVTDEVIESPASIVFDQAENRLHAQKAVMLQLMH